MIYKNKNVWTYVRWRKKRLHEESFMIFSLSKNYYDIQIKDDDICGKNSTDLEETYSKKFC